MEIPQAEALKTTVMSQQRLQYQLTYVIG